jgi:hypothetical protein
MSKKLNKQCAILNLEDFPLLPKYMVEVPEEDTSYSEVPDLSLAIGGCSIKRDNAARRYALYLLCAGRDSIDTAGALNIAGVPANTSNSIAFEVSEHIKNLEKMREVN